MRRQNGFGALQAILIIIILGIIGFAGWFVWQTRAASDKVANDTLKADSNYTVAAEKITSTSCTLASNKSGMIYQSTGKTFTFCVPNGWKLGVQSGSSSSSAAITADNNGDLPTYNQSTFPTLEKMGGGDGALAFSVYLNTPVAGNPEDYTKVGPITAKNSTGTEYTYTKTTDESAGLGDFDKGTVSSQFYFEKNGHSLSVTYNRFPGKSDQSALIRSIAQSVTFN